MYRVPTYILTAYVFTMLNSANLSEFSIQIFYRRQPL